MTSVYDIVARSFGRNDGLFVVLSRSGSLHRIILNDESIDFQKIADFPSLNIDVARNVNIVVNDTDTIYIVIDDTIVEVLRYDDDLWSQTIKHKQSVGMIDLWTTHVDYPGKIIRKDGLVAEIRKDASTITRQNYRIVVPMRKPQMAPVNPDFYELQFLEYTYRGKVYHFIYNQKTERLSVEITST